MPGDAAQLLSEPARLRIGDTFQRADLIGPAHGDWVSSLHIGDYQGFWILGVEPGQHVLPNQVGYFVAPIVEFLFADLEGNPVQGHLGRPLVVGEQITQPRTEQHRRIILIRELRQRSIW